MRGEAAVEIAVYTNGPVEPALVDYGRGKVGALLRLAPGPVLHGRLDLVAGRNPARERPAIAKAAFDVDGRSVRATAEARTMREAIDLVEARLRARIDRLAHRAEAEHLRYREPEQWRHLDPATPRPPYFPRPADDREIVRTKTFTAGPATAEEAAFEAELLDHDFHLFTDADSGNDAVVVRQPGGGFEVRTPVPITLDDAIERLDTGDEPFVCFVDEASRRGQVLYRRYDGHYGLVRPAD